MMNDDEWWWWTFKMYFQVKLLIWHYYKVHFLKVYLSMLGNIAMKVYFKFTFNFISLFY